MARVICSRPNASDEISGVKFASREGVMVSEEISAAAAETFLEIPGYELFEDQDVAANKALAKAQAAEAEAEALKKLTARAVELGVDVKPSWKAARLTAEIERAEDAAADAKAEADKEAKAKAEKDAAAAAAKTTETKK